MTDKPRHQPRVLLATLSVRTSGKGREYLSGYLGKAKVVAFAGEPDRWGNPTWDLFVSEPEPRAEDVAQRPATAAPPAADRSRWLVGGNPSRARPGAPGDPARADRLDVEIPI